MSSQSLIVLTNHVYAKKDDGKFYPGSVENKHEDNFVVLFADNTKQCVPEENITWLGFWGLPPSCWPKNPVIQPTESPDKEFVQVDFVEQFNDSSGVKPASLTVLKDDNNEKYSAENSWSFQPSMNREHLVPRNREVRLDSEDSTEEDVQDIKIMRSSVLRINSKALSKSKDLEDDDEPLDAPSPPAENFSHIELCSSSAFQATPKFFRRKRPYYRGMLAPVNIGRTESDKVLKVTKCSCRSQGTPKFETTYCRCENEEEVLDAEGMEYYTRTAHLSPYAHRSYQNLDWYETSHFNQSVPTSPIIPPSLSSSIEYDPPQPCPPSMRSFWSAPRHVRKSLGARFELPLFGHDPYGIRMVRDKWEEGTTGIGPVKKRRKDGLKKCRKVYGIYNRNLWCTQCKWKKACSRFRA